jgi:putative ABC transport system substrate-binding protein
MRRREFIAILGSTTVAWPRAARAQQPAIGFLSTVSSDASRDQDAAFFRGLNESGYSQPRWRALT